MTKPRLLVIGNGMAGLRFLEELIAVAPDGFDITAVGDEPEAAYNRVLLSPVLAGEIGSRDAQMRPLSWYAENGIRLISGRAVIALDAKTRTAHLDGGEGLRFDACVLATGSEPIRLPVKGAELSGVEVFRTFGDLPRLTTAAARGDKVVVIGGGLLGIEAAYGLQRAGAEVTLVHLMDRLMERQLDAEGAALVKAALESRGIAVCLRSETEALDGAGAIERLRLKGGASIEASLVVMAIGTRPRSSLAANAGISVRRGIIVDDHMRTSARAVYAIGECAEHDGVACGLVEPAYEHARVAARTIAGLQASFKAQALATNLKVSGLPVFSAGDFEGAGCEQIVWRDRAAGAYRKFVVSGDRLTGVVLVGDTADALWYRDLIRDGADIRAFRSQLPFGRPQLEAA